MMVLAVFAALVAVAGVVQAYRVGARTGEWLPFVLLVAGALLTAVVWLVFRV